MNKINEIITHPLFIEKLREIEVYERNRKFCKHDISHYFEVNKIMMELNIKHKLGYSDEMICGGALLHDLGKAIQYKDGTNHQEAGIEIAKRILKDCQYDNEEIEIICLAISEHSGFDTKQGYSELLRKSDKLSRRCFECKATLECKWPEKMRNKRSYL